MRKYCAIFLLVFAIGLGYSQNLDFKKYSYTELFEMIKAEKDSVFELSDAAIVVDPITDLRFTHFKNDGDFDPISDSILNTLDTLTIRKSLHFKNVHFQNKSVFVKTRFYKDIYFENSIPPQILHSRFDHQFTVHMTADVRNAYNGMHSKKEPYYKVLIRHNEFKGSVSITVARSIEDNLTFSPLSVRFDFNTVNGAMLSTHDDHRGNTFVFSVRNILPISIIGNNFDLNGYGANIWLKENDNTFIMENSMMGNGSHLRIVTLENSNLRIEDNIFPKNILWRGTLKNDHQIDWDGFSNKLISIHAYETVLNNLDSLSIQNLKTDGFTSDFAIYKASRRKNTKAFIKSQGIFSTFLNHYKQLGDKLSYNKVYVELKDLETEYFKGQYNTNPSFDTFFTFKVNQFLKVFSAYGTKPSKSIIFSMYVILLFASIYLFFPNSWDKHGKKRIVNRYSFFFKYMNKKAGIHEVYLDEQKEELMEYDEFKSVVESSGKTVPKFFSATALPLYKWAISGTKLTASFLKRVDIMKGKWQELPKSKRIWKSVLLVGAFIIAVSYDLYIKILNALMLSINTFTTLGFGEIPLKGLPRYLAIIQGFIGWFMLTIFSVSLISQLLN